MNKKTLLVGVIYDPITKGAFIRHATDSRAIATHNRIPQIVDGKLVNTNYFLDVYFKYFNRGGKPLVNPLGYKPYNQELQDWLEAMREQNIIPRIHVIALEPFTDKNRVAVLKQEAVKWCLSNGYRVVGGLG